MKPILPTPEILRVAARVVWFKTPVGALNDPITFLAHAMTYGTADDIVALQAAGFGLEDFREVLDNAPVGIFDPRSWAYWNHKCGRQVPALPRRKLA